MSETTESVWYAPNVNRLVDTENTAAGNPVGTMDTTAIVDLSPVLSVSDMVSDLYAFPVAFAQADVAPSIVIGDRLTVDDLFMAY